MAMSAPTLPSELQVSAIASALRSEHWPSQPAVRELLAVAADYIEQLYKDLFTMQRERDEALAALKISTQLNDEATWKAEVSIKGLHIATLEGQLAASERTCAELRVSIENAVVGMNTLSAQSVQLVDENARLIARAEAAERTVNNWREAMRQLGEVNEYELDQIEQRATEIGNKKG